MHPPTIAWKKLFLKYLKITPDPKIIIYTTFNFSIIPPPSSIEKNLLLHNTIKKNKFSIAANFIFNHISPVVSFYIPYLQSKNKIKIKPFTLPVKTFSFKKIKNIFVSIEKLISNLNNQEIKLNFKLFRSEFFRYFKSEKNILKLSNFLRRKFEETLNIRIIDIYITDLLKSQLFTDFFSWYIHNFMPPDNFFPFFYRKQNKLQKILFSNRSILEQENKNRQIIPAYSSALFLLYSISDFVLLTENESKLLFSLLNYFEPKISYDKLKIYKPEIHFSINNNCFSNFPYFPYFIFPFNFLREKLLELINSRKSI